MRDGAAPSLPGGRAPRVILSPARNPCSIVATAPTFSEVTKMTSPEYLIEINTIAVLPDA